MSMDGYGMKCWKYPALSMCSVIVTDTYGGADGGETGIRTLEGLAPLPVFKTGAFNRSAISPARITSYLRFVF